MSTSDISNKVWGYAKVLLEKVYLNIDYLLQ